MKTRYSSRELEFLARLRELSRATRTTLKSMQQDGYLTREAAMCAAVQMDDALLVAALADHASHGGSSAISEDERRQYLVEGLLKPLP